MVIIVLNTVVSMYIFESEWGEKCQIRGRIKCSKSQYMFHELNTDYTGFSLILFFKERKLKRRTTVFCFLSWIFKERAHVVFRSFDLYL